MRKQLLLGASFIVAAPALGMVQASSAAEPVIAPLYNWTGPYAGIAGGYGWGHSNQTDPGIGTTGATGTTGADGSYSLSGGILGGTLGYNWQQGPWVFGVEGDYSWADISGSSNTCGASFGTPHPCGTKLKSLGTLRGRIGYAMGATGNWLPYVTGGLLSAKFTLGTHFSRHQAALFVAGWTVGGGVEVGITQNWTAEVEYLYFDLGSQPMFNSCQAFQRRSVSPQTLSASV